MGWRIWEKFQNQKKKNVFFKLLFEPEEKRQGRVEYPSLSI